MTSHSLRNLIAFLVLTGLPGFNSHSDAQAITTGLAAGSQQKQVSTPQSQALTVGQSLERELKGGESHSYTLKLNANDYVNIVVEQKGIDVVVTLFAPDGTKLIEVDSPNGTNGPEPLYFVTEKKGDYRLEVKSLEKDAELAKYEAKIVELRPATKDDSIHITARLAAQKAFDEGEHFRTLQTNEGYLKAIEKYQTSLSNWQALGDKQNEANTLLIIGIVYYGLGELQKAMENFSQALLLKQILGDQHGQAVTLNNIGSVHLFSGQPQKAMENFSQALLLFRRIGTQVEEASTLNNIGTGYRDFGEKLKALEYYGQALQIWKAIGDQYREAITLNNIATEYDDLGEKSKALEYFGQALLIFQAQGNKPMKAITLSNIGKVYSDLSDQKKALENLSQALRFSQELGDKVGEARTLNTIGKVHSDLKEEEKAREYYTQALKLFREVGNRREEAHSLHNMGADYYALGDYPNALKCLNEALLIERRVGDRGFESNSLIQKSRVMFQMGNFDEAQNALEDSIELIESLRTDVGNKEFQSSYFASKQDVYQEYLGLLMEIHRKDPKSSNNLTALETSERSRARNLLELLTESHVNIREGVDPTLLEQEQQLQQKITAFEQQRTKLLSDSKTETQGQAFTKQIDELLNEYQTIQAQIRQKSPKYAALTQPKPLTVKEIQTQVLDRDTVLLEYSLGKERSYLWLVTPTTVKSYELPKEAEIEKLARPGYQALVGTRAVKPVGIAREENLPKLSQILLGPVAKELGKKRLVIVADGVLQYLPFAALPVPGQSSNQKTPRLLIDQHEIISLPSASTLAVIRKEQKDRVAASKGIAVLADPVFSKDDERLKSELAKTQSPAKAEPEASDEFSAQVFNLNRSREAFSTYRKDSLERLPGTEREAKAILSLMPESDCFKALDFDAARTNTMNGTLKPYRYVHFATHGLLDSERPEFSAIALSMVDRQGQEQDGFVRAFDVYNLQLSADVVVLSACQTGLGKVIRGEGLVGLTRGFMYAGAPRVVVSLWSVNDEATAELMTRFYRRMIVGQERPAAALRAAQQEMRKVPQWSAPYFWAAFTLQGEWK